MMVERPNPAWNQSGVMYGCIVKMEEAGNESLAANSMRCTFERQGRMLIFSSFQLVQYVAIRFTPHCGRGLVASQTLLWVKGFMMKHKRTFLGENSAPEQMEHRCAHRNGMEHCST